MTSFAETLRIAAANRAAREYPTSQDRRSVDGLIFPDFKLKFPVDWKRSTVFTIGSCFARNIEDVLAAYGADLPTKKFWTPAKEWRGRLNEYNPGTMRQRILFALKDRPCPTDTIVPNGDLYTDLLLPGGIPVAFERALQRRAEMAATYQYLARSSVVIITLGLTEAWFDHQTQLYLNQMPPRAAAAKEPDRFEFRQLDVFQTVPMLEPAIDALISQGSKVLLTVSPVPIGTTFTGGDCTVANEFSKAVLRVTAGRLAAKPEVDYFPSYKIVRSGGLSAYEADQVHVKNAVVERVTSYMVQSYAVPAAERLEQL